MSKYSVELSKKGWFTKYIYAFYWAVTTMTTVGLGDINPANIYEIVVYTIFMFISCGTFAYSFNSIGMIVQELNKKQKSVEI